ncbi:MAG: hypothetical protein WBA00_11445 [Rhodococcus sp. (in: high G+C Gram-positive bacteria)]
MTGAVRLIRRDRYGNELHRLDVAGRNEGAQGVKVTKMEGIWHAPRTSTDEQGAFEEGSRPGLSRVEPRQVKLTFVTEEVDDDEFGQLSWEEADDNLWQVMPAKAFFVLQMDSRDGRQTRELNLRRVIEPEPGRQDDPRDDGKMKWVTTSTAHDPFWYGEELYHEFIKGTGNGVGVVRDVVNPGDQPAVLKWIGRQNEAAETWTLPDANAVYPVGHEKAGQQVTHTIPQIPTGRHWMVDTHQLSEQLFINDTAQPISMMGGEFFSTYLPPTNDTGPIDLPVKVVGGTAWSGVRLVVPTRYDRPFGR